jgi:hypothetical protein
MSDTSVLASQRTDHTGRHVYFGIIGAVLSLVLLAGVSIYAYNTYVPASVHAQLQQEVAQLRTHLPQVQNNGGSIAYGVDQNGQPNRTVAATAGVYDELDAIRQGNAELKATIASANAETNRQIVKVSDQIAATNDSVKALGTGLDDLKTRVSKLETAQATPAPVQQPAPQAVPQTQAPTNPSGPAVTSQAAPAGQPAQQTAQAGGVPYTGVPNHWHIGKLYDSKKSEDCARQGKTLRLADYRKGECTSIANGGFHCEWSCR